MKKKAHRKRNMQITIQQATNGGFIVTHYDGTGNNLPTLIFSDIEDVMAYILTAFN